MDPHVDELIANCPRRRCTIDTFDEATILYNSIIADHETLSSLTVRHFTGRWKRQRKGNPPPPFLASLLERRAVPNSL